MPKLLAEQAPTVKLRPVTIWVDPETPLLQLKRALDWQTIHQLVKQHLRLAGCNVDGILRGRRLHLGLYVPMIILMLVMRKNSRQMEEAMSYHAVARDFLDLPESKTIQVRDHSTIARIIDKLGAEGLDAIAKHIAVVAVRCNFEDPSVLSADTTAQQLSIGYPNEPGILRGIAQRCLRACQKLQKAGRTKLQDVRHQAKAILKSAKSYHLFAKGQQAKEAVLQTMVRQTKRLLAASQTLTTRLGASSDTLTTSAVSKLIDMQAVCKTLLPQIKTWMQTGVVARDKIIHAGLTTARAIVRNKPGKKCEFGFRHLIVSLTRGYLVSQHIGASTSEHRMPALALSIYKELFGSDAAPDTFVYDRGAWSAKNVAMLAKEGVQNTGIQPKGKSRSRVHGPVKTLVLQQRSRIEGKIGTLKNDYKMDRPRERLIRTAEATTPRSVAAFNLTKLMKDVVTEGKKKAA